MSETISIKDESGKEYVFEKPEFGCELLKVYGNHIIGATQTDSGDSWMEEKWTIDGKSKHHAKWNITPIKPKWYEDEDKFPVLLINNDGSDVFFVETYPLNVGTKVLVDTKILGLATKEEVDLLYYQDKEML